MYKPYKRYMSIPSTAGRRQAHAQKIFRGALMRELLWTLVLVAAIALPPVRAEQQPTPQEMWQVIQAQQKTIEMLKNRLEATEKKLADTEQRVQSTDEKVEVASEDLEDMRDQRARGASWADKTSVGGYGELHYNNLENDGTGGDLDRVDFHRFVLYFAHEFTDRIRFFSELELEHALTADTADGSGPGEVELEQAFLEFDLTPNHRLTTGLNLIPVGIINPTHEPPTFYGAERNPVETEIIPSTWWEAEIGAHGQIMPGLNYDVMLHSGLEVPTTGSSAWRIRSGRNKVAEASADDAAMSARLRYTGIPGLEVGVTGQYQADVTQSSFSEDISAWLFEAHVDFRRGPFGFRGLYAHWDLDDGPIGTGPAAVGADDLEGFYVEPSYRFRIPGTVPGEIGVFARYNQYDARNGFGGALLQYIEYQQIDVGLNYWPHQNVVFKFDYQWQDADGTANGEFDGFNLGVGYQF